MYWQNPNNVVVGGNLTHEPSIREINSADGVVKVLDFSIANNLKSSNSPAGKPHYFRCEAWGKTAELIKEYFNKGDTITVVGCLQWHSWEDSKTGEKREAVRVRVENFHFAGGSGRRNNSSDEATPRESHAPNRSVKRPPPLPAKTSAPQLYPAAPADDDIPF